MSISKSIEDTYKYYLNNKYIFREFIKENNRFIALNNFYVSDEVDEGRLEFNNNIEKITPFNNIYMEIYNNENLFKNYIDLIIISNISFSLCEIDINKFDIIKKFIDKDLEIDEKILEDLYFNNLFSKKINIDLPNKYNTQIIMEEMNKKYLFKIDIDKLYQSKNEEFIRDEVEV
jgi:hypothetical protein